MSESKIISIYLSTQHSRVLDIMAAHAKISRSKVVQLLIEENSNRRPTWKGPVIRFEKFRETRNGK
jgi:hypothetical protein